MAKVDHCIACGSTSVTEREGKYGTFWVCEDCGETFNKAQYDRGYKIKPDAGSGMYAGYEDCLPGNPLDFG